MNHTLDVVTTQVPIREGAEEGKERGRECVIGRGEEKERERGRVGKIDLTVH